MQFSADRLLAHRFPEVRHRYAERDAILYGLGVGLGADPLDPVDLGFLDERRLSVLPTLAVTLASPGMWVREPALGIDWVKLLHVAQQAEFHAPLPPAAEVVGSARIASVSDLGVERGAEVVVERRIAAADGGALYCVLRQTLLLRGNGGFSGATAGRPARVGLPDREPDMRIAFGTSRRAALIYRLSGDWNPLHLDPGVAADAGFERPILHGLASFGIAGWVVLKALGEGRPERLKSLALRFTAPVTPGDELVVDLWRRDGGALFQATANGRVVLGSGTTDLD